MVSRDEETGKRLNGADKEKGLAISKELGVILTEADLIQNNELDTVAGGAECGCAMGGGQTGDNKCRCVCSSGGRGAD